MNIQDVFYVLKWFFVFFVVGTSFLPLTFSIFPDFKDKGYVFSKIIGLAFISYFIFIVGLLKIVKFTEISVYLSLVLFFILNYSFSIYKRENILLTVKKYLKVFVLEEIIFLIALFIWVFVRSNSPDINGLEKFMDYGFLNSIIRADFFPPKDMWYTPMPINYYYFGHLVTAVLTKLSFIPTFISYNLMISTLFALTFTASFSIGLNLINVGKNFIKSALSGIISAIFVTLGGNLTTIYAFFKQYTPADSPVPFWQLPFLPFSFPNSFWYPNATRFIPYTIHEFPIYSFVVSDLHGHVLDIPFVLLTIAVVYSFFIEDKINLKKLVFLSFLFSIMYMTNAWDGLIYLLLGLIFILFFNFYQKGKKPNFSLINLYESIKGFLVVFAGFVAFATPFSLNFKPFVSGIGIICAPKFLTDIGNWGPFLFEANHCQRSPLWQLFILYGFFCFFVVCFLMFLKFKKNYKLSKSDFFVLILISLSSILVVIPEFVYVKDIYPLHYRANTMFKLVYEAFIMLSLVSAFSLVKILLEVKNRTKVFIFILISSFIISPALVYPVFAINSYYKDLKNYTNLNGILYLSNKYRDDYRLILWINKNIKGQPVILEANGDSYTDYARISSNTGLPTLIGWPVHEWLWRGTYDLVSPRISEVQLLYTSNDINFVKKLVQKYNISYIAVSSFEREKYPNLKEEVFSKIGVVVFESGQAKLYKTNF